MKMFLAIFSATVKEYIRDRASWFWNLVFPLIFVFIFGWAYSGFESQTFNIGMIADSHSGIAGQIVNEFKGIKYFKVFEEKSAGKEQLMEALKKGKCSLVMDLSGIDGEGVKNRKLQMIPVYYDASKQQTNMILISAVSQITDRFQFKLIGVPKILEIEPMSILTRTANPNTFTFVLPGILAMALMQLGLFGGIQFLGQREQKIIRGLGVTPLSMITILVSAILFRLMIAVVQTFIIIFIGKLFFGVTFTNNIFQIFAIVILGSLTFISLGYMFTTFVKTSEAGQGLIQVVQFPMIFLSGIYFSSELMPSYIQPIVKVMPLTYLGDALRNVMVGIPSVYSLSTDVFVLCGWLAGSFILAIKFWQWE